MVLKRTTALEGSNNIMECASVYMAYHEGVSNVDYKGIETRWNRLPLVVRKNIKSPNKILVKYGY